MGRPVARLRLASAFALALAVGFLSTARAGLLAPNGNPSGAKTAKSATVKGGRADLGPPEAGYLTGYAAVGDIPWMADALDAQGFNAKNKWTFVTAALNGGDLELSTYLAFADEAPAIEVGAGKDKISNKADPRPDAGGLNIGVTYKPNLAPKKGRPTRPAIRSTGSR